MSVLTAIGLLAAGATIGVVAMAALNLSSNIDDMEGKEGCMTEDRDDRIERATLRDKALLRQALEALDVYREYDPDGGGEADTARQNLLALLAEQTDTQAQVDDRAIADNLDI